MFQDLTAFLVLLNEVLSTTFSFGSCPQQLSEKILWDLSLSVDWNSRLHHCRA